MRGWNAAEGFPLRKCPEKQEQEGRKGLVLMTGIDLLRIAMTIDENPRMPDEVAVMCIRSMIERMDGVMTGEEPQSTTRVEIDGKWHDVSQHLLHICPMIGHL